MKKALSLILGLMMVVALFAACGGAPAEPAPAEPAAPADPAPAPAEPAAPADDAGGPIRVGIINNPPDESGYRAANVADFERVFSAENGYDAQFFYSITNDEQLNAAQQYITDGVDYLLLSAADVAGWDGVFQSAQEAGTQVLLFDRMVDVDESLYAGAVVSDMAQEGKTAVAWLEGQGLDEYNVIHIQGVMGTDAQVGRTAAMDEKFASGWNKVIQQTGNWSEQEAQAIVESVIASGDAFNVVYAENDNMALGAVAALDAAGISHGVDGDVIIMGFDTNKWALEALLAGEWNYDGQCSPFQADVIDGMIKQLEAGQPLAQKKVISEEKGFDAATITQADVDQYGI